MEFLARCSRCGALVETSSSKFDDWKIVYYTPCTAVTKVSRSVNDYTALCPDCMEQLKAWLACEPEEPQGQEKADQSADVDSVERLAADMARIIAFAMSVRKHGEDTMACKYFGHYGVPCTTPDGAVCPDRDCDDNTCVEFALEDIQRRCKALGINIEEDADAKR